KRRSRSCAPSWRRCSAPSISGGRRPSSALGRPAPGDYHGRLDPQPSMSEPVPPFTPFAPPAGTFRILWCDADTARGDRAKRVLAGRATVDAVAEAGAAFESARGILPDLVVAALDAGLTEPALATALRANDRTRAVPVLLIAPNRDVAAEAARRFAQPPVACADVLAEPFADHELVARIGAQIEIIRLRRALAE